MHLFDQTKYRFDPVRGLDTILQTTASIKYNETIIFYKGRILILHETHFDPTRDKFDPSSLQVIYSILQGKHSIF